MIKPKKLTVYRFFFFFFSRRLVAFIHLFHRFLTTDVMTNKSRHHITPQETRSEFYQQLLIFAKDVVRILLQILAQNPFLRHPILRLSALPKQCARSTHSGFDLFDFNLISSGVSRHRAPYLALLPPSCSFTSFRPPLTDKTQNFDSSLWAGARKFLAGSLCPRQGITQWSYGEVSNQPS